MMDRIANVCLGIALIGMCFWIASIGLRATDTANRVQALEQSQCAVKQESAHNRVKFDLCMDKQKR